MTEEKVRVRNDKLPLRCYVKIPLLTDAAREFRIFKENDDIKSKNFFFQKEREKFINQVKSHNKKQQEKRALRTKWNGIVGDLVAGVADMSFAPLSISK